MADGTYDHIFTLDFTPDHVNAAAMFETTLRTENFAMAAVDGRLCRFDRHSAYVCDSEALYIARPNLGAILGTTYYYAKNLGEEGNGHIYFVEDIQTDSPYHVDEAALEVSADVFEGAVLDFAAVQENGKVVFDDRYDDAAYLVGLAHDYSLLVVHLDSASGAPDAYVVMGTTVDWNGVSATGENSDFGAAYAYRFGSRDFRLFFASNEGHGIFRMEPGGIEIPDGCWNVGDDVAEHAKCEGVSAGLYRIGPSVASHYNDGLNCPGGGFTVPTPTGFLLLLPVHFSL